jgi:hypothetical protein
MTFLSNDITSSEEMHLLRLEDGSSLNGRDEACIGETDICIRRTKRAVRRLRNDVYPVRISNSKLGSIRLQN